MYIYVYVYIDTIMHSAAVYIQSSSAEMNTITALGVMSTQPALIVTGDRKKWLVPQLPCSSPSALLGSVDQ